MWKGGLTFIWMYIFGKACSKVFHLFILFSKVVNGGLNIFLPCRPSCNIVFTLHDTSYLKPFVCATDSLKKKGEPINCGPT